LDKLFAYIVQRLMEL